MNSFYLQQIGLLLSVSDRQLAGTFMEHSHIRSAKRDAYVLSWVEWLLWNNERSRAIEVLRDAYLKNPRLAIISYPLLHGFSFTRNETELMLPPSAEVWVKYGLFLNELGDVEGGEYYLNRSLDLLNIDVDVSAGVFTSLYRYFNKRKQSDKAIKVIRQGIQKIPDNATFHALLGDYYLEKGIIYRAEDEYQQALMLNPEERDIRRKIDSLGTRK